MMKEAKSFVIDKTVLFIEPSIDPCFDQDSYGYRIRRGAIDHNIPLMTNVRLAKAFIDAFCSMKLDDIKIKSWQEYNA